MLIHLARCIWMRNPKIQSDFSFENKVHWCHWLYFGDSYKHIWHSTYNLLQENIFVKLNKWILTLKSNIFPWNTSEKVDFWIPSGPKIQTYYCLFSLTIGGFRDWRYFLRSQNQPISRTYCIIKFAKSYVNSSEIGLLASSEFDVKFWNSWVVISRTS